MRIASLLPAATEIVCALGLRDRLVARSHECDFPLDVAELPALTRSRFDSSLASEELDREVRRVVAEGLPIYRLDEDGLAALAPDVVVTQAACEVCAIAYDQVVESVQRASLSARVVSLQPARLHEVLDDVRAVASACGVAERGETVVAGLRERLRRVAAKVSGRARPRVAVVEWLAPPMLAAHWVPDAIEAAGGDPVGPAPGTPSPYATWDEIRALRADAVIVAACGFDLPRTVAEARPVRDQLLELAPRVLVLDGNAYLNRPGPRLVEAVEEIAGWLQGGDPDPSRGVSWCRPSPRP